MGKDSGFPSRWECIDFELEIRECDPRDYSVAVRSPEGEVQAREEMHFPFDEQELEDKLEELEGAVYRSGRGYRRIRLPEAQTVQDFGAALFRTLLPGQVGAHYEARLREARRQNKGLRLKLRVHPPKLVRVPWEFIYDPDSDAYLCLSSKTPLVRYPEQREPIEQLPMTPPLRILGMVASPFNLPRLKVEREKRRVREAVSDLEAKGRVELTWLEGQTPRDLLRAMSHGPWHIFHFIGHGDFDPVSEEGRIALMDEEDGDARFLHAEDLAQLLKDHWDLRLVLLNSCKGAQGSEHDAFSSTAATLVRPGIPAVLANQYEISDDAAIEFSRAFYEAVADGLPLDAAVSRARTMIKIQIDNTLEWVTPVLYMRSSDGHIFDIQEETEGEGDALRRYREHVEWAWADGKLHSSEARTLRELANDELGLSSSIAAGIEREIMGDTIEAILERQRQATEQKYRRAVAEAWTDGELDKAAVGWLKALRDELGLSTSDAAKIEHQVMGDAKEAILERQTREWEEEERRNRLDELYARARLSHQDGDWEAVVALFDQIHATDQGYPDPEGLLATAREGLALARTVADQYDQGLRHMKLQDWTQALRCFEQVRLLSNDYREVEDLLSRVRHELASPPAVEVPDLSGQSRPAARSMLAAAGLKLGGQAKTSNDDVSEGRIVKQYPVAGTRAKWGSSVSIMYSSGPEKRSTTAVPDVLGKNLEEAGRILSGVGLVLESSLTQKSSKRAGTVISTDPPAGSEADATTPVIATVSSGPHESPAKPTFLPGEQKSKPRFLPGKEKSKPALPSQQQQKPKPGRPRSLPSRKAPAQNERNSR